MDSRAATLLRAGGENIFGADRASCGAIGRGVRASSRLLLIGIACGMATAAAAQTADEQARLFGARPWASFAALSPDGKHLVFIAPAKGAGTTAVVEDLADGSTRPVLAAGGDPLILRNCGWASNDRIICRMTGTFVTAGIGQRLLYGRTLSVGIDGKQGVPLSKRNDDGSRMSMDDGRVIDWLAGDGSVLMIRDTVRQRNRDTNIVRNKDGLGVERVDAATGRGTTVAPPNVMAIDYIADGNGVVRIMAQDRSMIAQVATNITDYRYRTSGGGDWQPFSQVAYRGPGLRPIAVDGGKNVAYALDNRSGRDALYRVSLDGTKKTELVYADPEVDVDDVVTIGRHGRVIGATYVTDRRNVVYFDPEYQALAAGLARALPKTPLIDIASASADERKLLIFASGDADPGRFYLFDRDTKKMVEVLQSRPPLASQRRATVQAISYPAADGTRIPAYLTLPPGGPSRGLPAIVLPHGGPSSRDEWGFDWLSQYFAARGFAVLQPQYRDSAGYGTSFLNGNGLRSWRQAISDILDAGRWLDKEGIAAKGKLAIVGWSYGGYAALQANVIDPDLFKAAIAVAPVTDFDMLREQYRVFSGYYVASREIGTGGEAVAGSPLRHAGAIKAPVLMFHGDRDLNVDVGESRAMDAALKRAGKQSTLVVYPGLDHQLPDGDARADMLTKADAFLRTQLHVGQ